MKNIVALFMTLIMSLAFTAPASARDNYDYKASDLTLIGDAEVEPRNSRVVIKVGKDQGLLEAIALRARDRSVRLRGMTVYFGDGSRQEIDLYERLRPDQTTRIIDLKGERRFVKRLEIEIRPRFRRNRIATLEALAIESPPELRHLATGIIKGRVRTIEIPVGTEFGRMTSLVVRAEGRSFRIREIDIEFGDRTRQVVRLNRLADEGSLTEIHRLAKRRKTGTRDRYIRNVTMTLRPTFSRRTGKLEIFGQEAPYGSNRFKIADASVEGRRDPRVVFRVGRGKFKYTGIALGSLDRTVRIRDVEVVFADRRRRTYPLQRILGKNRETQTIYFNPSRFTDRDLRRVVVYLQRTPRRGRARLQLLGQIWEHPTAKAKTVYAKGRKVARRNRRDRYDDRRNQDWVLLGTRTASLFSIDNDTFHIGRDKGRFKAIRVHAHHQDIRMYGMQIVYGNGTVEDVPIYGTLEENETSQAFDLKGRHRFIDRITFRYRTRLNFRGSGEMELWGLQRR